MIEAPERQIEAFAEAGADSITFHAEATPHANRTLGAIRELGCLAGVAINPGTPVEAVSELEGLADIVLCMTVNPGWGGQAFIESSPDKVTRLAPLVGDAKIEVDGGIDPLDRRPDGRGRRLPVRRRLGRLRRRRPGCCLRGDRRRRRAPRSVRQVPSSTAASWALELLRRAGLAARPRPARAAGGRSGRAVRRAGRR